MFDIDSNLIKIIFGLKLKQTRVEQGLSLTDLSRETGISKSYLTEIEQGKKYPKTDKILELARTLNVSYDYLINLDLSKKLAPISDLIRSGFHKSIPLEFIGINESELITILASAPTQFSAFIDSLIQLATYYDIRLEDFYFSVLRSYQEMNDNYFENLEKEANEIRLKYEIDNRSPNISDTLQSILEKKYGYKIFCNHELMNEYPELRYIMIPSSKKNRYKTLYLNPKLNENQKIFTFSREIGFSHLKIENRPKVSSWIDTDNFELILNNFRAYYFGSSLLLNDRYYVKGLSYFLNKERFSTEEIMEVIQRNNVTPEVFMLRLTNLVPRYLRYNEFIFFRYNKNINEETYSLNKELYGSGLPGKLRRTLESKSVLRYMAIKHLANYEVGEINWSIEKVRLEESTEEFMIIGISQDMKPSEDLCCYIGVAFRINSKLKEKVLFLKDPGIQRNIVNLKWLKSTNAICEDGLEHLKDWDSSSRKFELKAKIANILTD